MPLQYEQMGTAHNGPSNADLTRHLGRRLRYLRPKKPSDAIQHQWIPAIPRQSHAAEQTANGRALGTLNLADLRFWKGGKGLLPSFIT